MKQYTEEQLKAALVKALPEKLEAHINDEALPYYSWREQFDGQTNVFVTPHEWPAIVGMVEDRLTEEQLCKYGIALGNTRLFIFQDGSAHWGKLACAKWPVRAQAFADIGAIKVEEA